MAFLIKSSTLSLFLKGIFLPSLIHFPVQKVLFLCQISEIEILMYLHVLKPTDFKNYIISGLTKCVSVFSVTQKQFIVGTLNLILYKCVIQTHILKIFVKIGQIIFATNNNNNSNTLQLMDRTFSLYILIYLDCSKCHKISIYY